jgi:hypothetical protein
MPTFSSRHRFSDWPNADVPAVGAGVYAVWEGERLIYCGMSGRGLEKALGTKPKLGLATRLASHTSGRLSGDQFIALGRVASGQLRAESVAFWRDRRRSIPLTETEVDTRDTTAF